MSETKTAPTEESFNEAELEDIMSEIENLEKDFSSTPSEVGGTEEFKELSPDEIPSDDDIFEDITSEEVEVAPATTEESPTDPDLDAFEAELLGDHERVSESDALRVDSSHAGKTELQSEIEREMTRILESSKDLEVVTERAEEAEPEFKPEPKTEFQEEALVETKSEPEEAQVLPLRPKEENRLSFQVTGQMVLGLDLNIGGRSLKLSVSEEGLVIELEEGAKFSLPLKHRKVA